MTRPREGKRTVKLDAPPHAERIKPIVLDCKLESREVTATGKGGLGWGTMAVFALFFIAAVIVFFFLPQWVEERPAPAASSEPTPPLESPQEEAPPADEADRTPEPAPAKARATTRQPEERGDEPRATPKTRPKPRPAVSEPTPETTHETRTTDEAFTQAMSEGMAALEHGDYRGALGAFQRANKIRPGAHQTADGRAQAEEGLKLQAIEGRREKALASEKLERWREAAAQYQAVLELDPTIRFAQDGKVRSLERAELSEGIEFHLKNPSRLSDDNVLAEASSLLTAASRIESAGPRLSRQRTELEALIAKASKPVLVVLESDNLTDVTLYKKGRLGKLTHRELRLRPGTYTVVGSRRGYKDVRRRLVVEAEADGKIFEVRCEEKI